MVDLKLVSYIKTGFKKGYSKEELLKTLIKNDWTKKEFNIAFKFLEKHKTKKSIKIEKPKNNGLIEFIENSLRKGVSEGEIKLALSGKGWKKETVNNAFKKIKFPIITQKKEEIPYKIKQKIKPNFKNVFLQIISFLVIALILSLTFSIFIYLQGLNNYTITDQQGNILNKTCVQENCSDMINFAFSYVFENIWLYVGISVLIALGMVVLYLLLPFKKELLWIFNIFYFAFLLIITYNWILFQQG
jgi:hypothetical protein